MLHYLRIPAFPYVVLFALILYLVGGIFYDQQKEHLNAIYDQNAHSIAQFPGPEKHPYDPAHPIQFPSGKFISNGSQAIYNKTTKPPAIANQTKPHDVATPVPKPTTPPVGQDTQAPIVPGTLAPTPENEFKINSKTNDMSAGCPVMAPTGKLQMAITAWTNMKRTGKHMSDSGSIDMGVDGGWYDYDGKGCCDYYFRKIDSHWMAIAPQLPFNEYTKLTPQGSQCDAFAGAVIAKGYHA